MYLDSGKSKTFTDSTGRCLGGQIMWRRWEKMASWTDHYNIRTACLL